jgi:CPA1 family monovalent cation:H+ antiporter
MANYSIVLFILLFMVTLSVFSNRLKIPYPILLVLTGVVVGLIPSWPYIKLDPEVVFLLFLPPLLYDSAFNISFKSFRENFSTIRTLAFPLVFFTATGIAIFARFLFSGLTWPRLLYLEYSFGNRCRTAIGITKNLGLSPNGYNFKGEA